LLRYLPEEVGAGALRPWQVSRCCSGTRAATGCIHQECGKVPGPHTVEQLTGLVGAHGVRHVSLGVSRPRPSSISARLPPINLSLKLHVLRMLDLARSVIR